MVDRIVRLCVLLSLAIGFGISTGCCSIIVSSHKTIQVTSNPSGMPVEIYNGDGVQVAHGVTPFPITLKRGDGYFSAAKYEFKGIRPGQPTKVVGFKAGINPWYWGNIVFGGLIGCLIVDPITGAMWEPPDNVEIDCTQPVPSGGTRADANNLGLEISYSCKAQTFSLFQSRLSC